MPSIRLHIPNLAWVCSIVGSLDHSVVPETTSGSTTLTETDLRKIFVDTAKQVNEFYKAETFPVLAPSPQFNAFKFVLNSDYHETTGVFDQTERAPVGCEILAKSGKFVEFHNYAAENAFDGASKTEIPPQPKWTKEQAIAIALKFANIFTKPWGATLGHPVANYNFLSHDVDKKTGKLLTAPGQWTIRWLEQTTSGVFYQSGGVTVQLSEKYGPDAVYIHFQTHYEDEHIVPIPQTQALIEARKGLDKIRAWEPAKEMLGHMQVLDTPPPFAILMIVQPNHMTEQKSLYAAAVSNQLRGRLAWVVTYKINSSTTDAAGIVSVYIDAKDGSLLGGYF